MSKRSTWKEYAADFENYVSSQNFQGETDGLFEPIRYMMDLGGKRIRPALCLLGYALFKEDFQSIFPTALGIELFHNFTLVHDDIMDEADVRRGKPTIEKKYGLPTAILSGDMIMIMAYQYLCQNQDANQAEVLNLFNLTAQQVCEGQQLDLEFEKLETVSLEEYKRMINWKTSVLLAASAKIGALRAGASEQNAELVYEFANELGLAFQIQDDFLDVFGDADKFGKKVGGDIIQKKKTFLMLSALNSARGNEVKAALNSDKNETDKVAEVKSLYVALGIDKASRAAIEAHSEKALGQLDAISVPEERKTVLRSLVSDLLIRES